MRYAALLGLVASLCAHAGTIVVGGSTMLSQSDADQIASWLGEGDLILTNIFTKTPGSTSADFHSAVDGRGRTFTILQAIADPDHLGTESILIGGRVGGYNPQSWDSLNGYHLTPLNADRTAFLFNLESLTRQSQNLTSEGDGSSGEFQTMNLNTYGPTFGNGHDIFTSSDLAIGHNNNHSYGGTTLVTPIVSGSLFADYYAIFEVGDLEVFTISNAAVPEPGAFGLLSAALTVAIGLRLGRMRF